MKNLKYLYKSILLLLFMFPFSSLNVKADEKKIKVMNVPSICLVRIYQNIL